MMIGAVLNYASAQARIRARLGDMPRRDDWTYFLDADDLGHLLERMRGRGLDFWLEDLGSAPSADQINAHLVSRSQRFAHWLGRLLPPRWREVDRWLRCMPLGTGEEADADSPGAVEVRWWQGLLRRLPAADGQEREMIQRLERDIKAHLEQVVRAGEEQHARHPEHGRWMQWQLRSQLEVRLRGLLSFGHPFHAAFVLAYGLLEAIQAERLRALLLARQAHWPLDARMLGSE